ncbi:glyoxalase/bleomycin resistance/dioxygenase family protein [Occultella glacieicola]|uniref:Glyoxalase/bleomycin resistance/dioxygenase family protein n=1 Tax=Occultella glacieicola TaxID=2518684 RepID=A0ABY2DXF2_9MICO|nr:VOC family protein [Occultella glacieicola]TDE88823.1 glyoxalase/bleomycin resistance/dioxygenase family protein [Occultella glacieicola]
MHRSRIGVVLIDHPADRYPEAARFWAAATGGSATGDPAAEQPYEHLAALGGDVSLYLQRTGTGTPPGVHLDIETDDVPAETARLLELGARVVVEHDEYRVLTDPGGLVFCIVPVQTKDFAERARVWP